MAPAAQGVAHTVHETGPGVEDAVEGRAIRRGGVRSGGGSILGLPDLFGELAVTVPQLREFVAHSVHENPELLVLDLLKVDFLSSAGMSLLVELHTQTRLRVVADGRSTSRPLHLMGMDQEFPVVPTLEEALTPS